MRSLKYALVGLTLSLSLGLGNLSSNASAHEMEKAEAPEPGDYSYGILVFSYVPELCTKPENRHLAPEVCSSGKAFIARGIWPSYGSGAWVTNCQDVPPLQPTMILSQILKFMPSANPTAVNSWINHDWATHGSCFESDGTQDEYFTAILKVIQEHGSGWKTTPQDNTTTIDRLRSGWYRMPATAFNPICTENGYLKEVHISLDRPKKGETSLIAAPSSEKQKGTCPVSIRLRSI